MADESKGMTRSFWPVFLAVLVIAVLVLLFRAMGSEDDEVPSQEPVPSTEWTTAPEGGVDVNLPDTPMRNVRPDENAPEGENASETE